MKKMLFFAVACVALVSCSSDGFIGDSLATSSNGEITFSQSTPNITRAAGTAADAAKLNNNFIVYGFKMDKGATEATNGSTDKTVFDMYNVKYTSGSANSTLSNTTGWEYVGYTSKLGADQSIKYWDFNSKYVFSAISCGDAVIPTKITDAATIAGTTVNEKGWLLTVPAGAGLGSLYASDRKAISKKLVGGVNTFPTVDFTFYSLAAKVRFGFYETVSGYSVKIDNFYYTDGTEKSTDKNFAISGTFKGMNEGGNTNLVVTYDASNHPILSFDSESTTTYKIGGTNLQAQSAIGTTTNTATYDQAENNYTLILPYQSQQQVTPVENALTLKLDYTLISTDGSAEEIKVMGATAIIPTTYTQWKNNYAYTYLFKISDNTSGSTGGDPEDPKGLYPITFDACVASAQDGTQETVTTVAEPSITTYQAGEVVTTQDGYKAGNIDVTVNDLTDGAATLTAANLKLYTAICTDGTDLTEKNVENYANNGIVLTDVSSALKFVTTTASFTAVANKAYVVEFIKGATKSYKVIKVGTPAAASYTLKAYATGTSTPEISTIAEGGSFDVKVFEGSDPTKFPVTGAAKNFDDATNEAFTIAETATPGTYTFTAKGGTSGAKTIKINTGDTGASITIQPYEFADANVNVIADDNTPATITLNFNGAAAADVDVDDNFTVPTGVTITGVADGVVTLTAAKTAQNGKITYSSNGIEVASADVTIQHYSFEATNNVINIGSVVSTEKSTKLTMKLAGVKLEEAKSITTTTTPASNVLSALPTTTSAEGEVQLTAGSVPGIATVTAPDDTQIAIEVKKFTVSVSGTTVTFYDNGVATNASIVVDGGTLTKAVGTGVYTWTGAASGNTITYTYKGVTFTLYKKS